MKQLDDKVQHVAESKVPVSTVASTFLFSLPFAAPSTTICDEGQLTKR
jgi:hypothetical protein